jgi:hypothetical protein
LGAWGRRDAERLSATYGRWAFPTQWAAEHLDADVVVDATIEVGGRANMEERKCREVMETLVRHYLCLTQKIAWMSRTGEGEKWNGKYLVYSLRTSWQRSDQRDAGVVDHPGTASHGIESLGTAPYVQIMCHAAETYWGEGWSWRRS